MKFIIVYPKNISGELFSLIGNAINVLENEQSYVFTGKHLQSMKTRFIYYKNREIVFIYIYF